MEFPDKKAKTIKKICFGQTLIEEKERERIICDKSTSFYLRFWGQKFEEETSIVFETETKFCNVVSQMYTILSRLIIEVLRQIIFF